MNCLLAYDEEFDRTARYRYAYDPGTLAFVLFFEARYPFRDIFNIRFTIKTITSWDSYDDPVDHHEMIEEVKQETGFQKGEIWNYLYLVHLLIAFTDQDIPGTVIGYCNDTLGVIIVQHLYLVSVGQLTDNILQHELTHLYHTQQHWIPNFDCVMNEFPTKTGAPDWMLLPEGILTTNWCEACTAKIWQNKHLWGYESDYGGGGGGTSNPIPCPSSENIAS